LTRCLKTSELFDDVLEKTSELFDDVLEKTSKLVDDLLEKSSKLVDDVLAVVGGLRPSEGVVVFDDLLQR